MPDLVVIDTNVLIHYQTFDEVDWATELGLPDVTLIVVPDVLREVDKLKNNPKAPWKQGRAKTVSKKLSLLIEKADDLQVGTPLRAGVELRFISLSPTATMHKLGLDIQIVDDRIIASAIDLQNSTGEAVSILTADNGPRLTARLHGLRSLKPPEHLRLYPNRVEKRQSNQPASPDLSVENAVCGTSPELLPIQVLEEWDQTASTAHRAEIERLHPHNKSAHTLDFGLGGDPIAIPTHGHNSALTAFHITHTDWRMRLSKAKNESALCHEFSVRISNSGSAPATNIQFSIRFPDGFYFRSFRPLLPVEPRPPSAGWNALGLSYRHPEDVYADDSLFEQLVCVHESSIDRLLHHKSIELNYRIQIPISHSGKPFHANWEMVAGNIPRKMKGNLTFLRDSSLPLQK